MFNFGNNVDRDKLWNSTSSPVCTDERQSRHNVTRGQIITSSFNSCSTKSVEQARAGDSRLSTKVRHDIVKSTKSSLTLRPVCTTGPVNYSSYIAMYSIARTGSLCACTIGTRIHYNLYMGAKEELHRVACQLDWQSLPSFRCVVQSHCRVIFKKNIYSVSVGFLYNFPLQYATYSV